jgi:hypothetical protein
MTAAERQRAYRQRKIADGTDSRLDVVVSASAAAALLRLARHHGISQRAMLEQVLAQAEQATVAGMADPSGYYRVTG